MQKINDLLKAKKDEILKDPTVNSYTVNSKKRSLTTVNSKDDQPKTFEEEISEVIERHGMSKKSVAQQIAELLKDPNSVGYYEILLDKNKPGFLLQWAHYTKDMDLQGKIRTSRPIYFQAILRKLKIPTKFKKAT